MPVTAKYQPIRVRSTELTSEISMMHETLQNEEPFYEYLKRQYNICLYIYIYFGCWIKSSPEFFLPIILSGHGLPAGHSGSFSPTELSLRNWPWDRPEHQFSSLVLVKLIFLGYRLHPRFICSQLTLNCFALVSAKFWYLVFGICG